jgi:hypothetical protein
MNKAHHCTKPEPRIQVRGVSLIEALLALVVMSLGMLAVVGVQATLRSNGDLSRQRAEAVRLAQLDIENLRAFTGVTAVVGRDFTDIVSTAANVTPAGSNATYTLTRTVPADPLGGSPPFRTASVRVEWKDRTGGPDQKVELFTGTARIAPALSVSLAVPPNGGPARQPQGRHFALPKGTVPLTGSTSAFTPPLQPPGPVTRLIFNNLTGLITCIEIDGVCGTDTAQLLTGFVGVPAAATVFTLAVDYTTTADAVALNRTESCFLSAPEDPLNPVIEYVCAVRMPTTAQTNPTWSGKLVFGPTAGFVAAVADTIPATSLRACRYSAIAATYDTIKTPLNNQNFVLKLAPVPCPAGTANHQPSV